MLIAGARVRLNASANRSMRQGCRVFEWSKSLLYYSSPEGETRRHSLPKSQAFSLIYNSDQYQQQLLFAFLHIYYIYIFVTLVKYFSKLHFEL